MRKKVKRSFKLEKKHIQGFVAGIIIMLIIFGGIYVANNPNFLLGSMYNNGQVTDDNFDSRVLKSDRPVLVYFYAEWATGGRYIAEALEEIRKEYSNYISVVKINVDQNSNSATNYGIRSVPTLAIFDKGKLVSVKAGNLGSYPQGVIHKWLSEDISWEFHEDQLPDDKGNALVVCHVYPKIVTKKCSEGYAPDLCMSEILLLPYDFTLRDSIKCDGSSLKVSNNNALYSLLGNTYGGKQATNFNLPDLTNKSPLVGLNYYMGTYGFYPIEEYIPSSVDNDLKYLCYDEYYSEYFVGQIVLARSISKEYNSNMIPSDGRELKINDYQMLYYLLGNKFGGDGKTTFRIPDLSKIETPVKGTKYYIAVMGDFPYRD